MKKRILSFLVALIMFSSVFILTACGSSANNDNQQEKTILSYEIVGLEESYEEYDEINLDDIEIKINYSDGTSTTVKLSPEWIKYLPDFATIGDQEVSILYNGVEIKVPVRIVPAAEIDNKAKLQEFLRGIDADSVKSIDFIAKINAYYRDNGVEQSVNQILPYTLDGGVLDVLKHPENYESYIRSIDPNYLNSNLETEKIYLFILNSIYENLLNSTIVSTKDTINAQRDMLTHASVLLNLAQIMDSLAEIYADDSTYIEIARSYIKSNVINIVNDITETLYLSGIFEQTAECREDIHSFVDSTVRYFINNGSIDEMSLGIGAYTLLRAHLYIFGETPEEIENERNYFFDIVGLLVQVVNDFKDLAHDSDRSVEVVLSLIKVEIDAYIDIIDEYHHGENYLQYEYCQMISQYLEEMLNALDADIEDIVDFVDYMETTYGVVNTLHELLPPDILTEDVDELIQGFVDAVITEDNAYDYKDFVVQLATKVSDNISLGIDFGVIISNIFTQHEGGEITELSSLYTEYFEDMIADFDADTNTRIKALIVLLEDIPFVDENETETHYVNVMHKLLEIMTGLVEETVAENCQTEYPLLYDRIMDWFADIRDAATLENYNSIEYYEDLVEEGVGVYLDLVKTFLYEEQVKSYIHDYDATIEAKITAIIDKIVALTTDDNYKDAEYYYGLEDDLVDLMYAVLNKEYMNIGAMLANYTVELIYPYCNSADDYDPLRPIYHISYNEYISERNGLHDDLEEIFSRYIQDIANEEFEEANLVSDVVAAIIGHSSPLATTLSGAMLCYTIYTNINNDEFDFNELFEDIPLPPMIESIDFNTAIRKLAQDGAFDDLFTVSGVTTNFIYARAGKGEVLAQEIKFTLAYNLEAITVATRGSMEITLRVNY